MSLRKRTALILGACFLLACFLVLLVFGREYTFEYNVPQDTSLENYMIMIDQDDSHPAISVREKSLNNGKLRVTIEGVERGKAFIVVLGPGPEDYVDGDMVHVHVFHIITTNGYLGFARGMKIFPICTTIFLLVFLVLNIYEYRKSLKITLYRYKNVRNLSWVIVDAILLLGQLQFLLGRWSLVSMFQSELSSAHNVAFFMFPLAFILSILVIISNFRLMQKEGRTWRNMLGLFLSFVVCVGTVFPFALDEWLYNHQSVIEVHNQRSPAIYIELLIMSLMLILVVYLEVVLVSTVILSIKAAKRIPAFDKDYILIHGCQIREDGTLTKLLQGRVDRALEFARMQKEHTGKALVFVPSGGKGDDEVISEAKAISNYLREKGVPEDQILPEDQSTTTQENMEKSRDLILAHSQGQEPKVAFSTTNYHVFRSGVLAERAGLHAEGIGSPTRKYFWINAFIREFIATLVSEKRKHFRVLLVLGGMATFMAVIVYFGNIL